MENRFLSENFLLETDFAKRLYSDYAKDLPILDYHNHLPSREIFEDRKFENLTQIWLNDDHYKWRAMRAMGVEEKYITGEASDREKFYKWAETVPYTLRNPLYHWTHLELQRYFDIDDLLNPHTADAIYESTAGSLRKPEYAVQGLLKKMNVELLCTTDDPLDALEFHQPNNAGVRVLPTFRPDKAMAVEKREEFLQYIKRLSEVSDIDINSYASYLEAMQKRHDYFHSRGCRLSDHGISRMEYCPYTENEIKAIFIKILNEEVLNQIEISQLKTALLLEFAKMNHAKGWAQQFHIGPLRNNNRRMLKALGPDTGFDSIGDYNQAENMARFFDELDSTDQLAKTIIYNLNPADNEVFAAMTGNYNDGLIRGKMQYGAAWWFSDQLDGMERQINALSNIGLLSCFVGMVTDSRSFLSFPRHEYFRRLLCAILGRDVEKGLIPKDEKLLGEIVQNISYYNAKNYFDFSR